MERSELEKLMDRYKKEMLEFSRKNGGKYAPPGGTNSSESDRAEENMERALENGEAFERDRSNPLGTPEPEAMPEEMPPEEQAVPAQTNPPIESVVMNDGAVDVSKYLRENCAKVASDPNATAEQKARCRDIGDFLSVNSESGTMRVETFAGDRAFGVGSSRVVIFLPLKSGNVAVFDGITDINGNTGAISLPAPPKEIGLTPQKNGSTVLPYSVYSVYVEHPGYVRAIFTNVPVFSGIESIQPVRMLAKSEGTQEPAPIVVDQSNRNQLQG